jgi:hypothetical protein
MTHLNIGTAMRGTFIVMRNTVSLEHVHQFPSRRAIAATCGDLRLVNIYVPSGNAAKAEREHFYNSELPGILRHTSGTLMIGCDYNCTQSPSKTTGTPNPSNALAELVRHLSLTDTWTAACDRAAYIHYTHTQAQTGSTEYTFVALHTRKVGTTRVPVPFSDHHAVIVSINIPYTSTWWPRRSWMIPTTISKTGFMLALRDRWTEWKRVKRHYPNVVLWWTRHVQRRFKMFCRQQDAGLKRETRLMEEHLYRCVHDITQREMPHDVKRRKLNCYKARILRLHSARNKQSSLTLR